MRLGGSIFPPLKVISATRQVAVEKRPKGEVVERFIEQLIRHDDRAKTAR
jgi:transposase